MRLVFALLLVFVYQAESPPAYQASPNSENGGKSQSAASVQAPSSPAVTPVATANQEPTDQIKRSEWVQIFISGFVALIVLWQSWIINEQRKMADRQFAQTYLAERAYISLLSLEVSDLRPNQCPLITTRIVNGGRTPAWNVDFQIKWGVGPEEVVRPWTPSKTPSTSHFFLAAGQTNTTKRRLEKPLLEENIRVLEDDSMQFFVTVQCRYVDFKGEQREASFPGVYDRHKGNFVWNQQKISSISD